MGSSATDAANVASAAGSIPGVAVGLGVPMAGDDGAGALFHQSEICSKNPFSAGGCSSTYLLSSYGAVEIMSRLETSPGAELNFPIYTFQWTVNFSNFD